MKNMRVKLIVLFILCAYSISFAQRKLSPKQWEDIHSQDILCTEYIFDGIVVGQKQYYDKKRDSLTCNIVKINWGYTNRLPGEGTIKIITKGWHTSKDSNFISRGRVGYFTNKEHCVFFCNLATPDMLIDSLPITDSPVLMAIDTISSIVYTSRGLQWDDTIYNSHSLFKFFRENHKYDMPIIPPRY